MSSRCCPNCHEPVAETGGSHTQKQGASAMCQRCGMAIPPARDGYVSGLRMHFRTAVILLTLFCVVMMFWLPR